MPLDKAHILLTASAPPAAACAGPVGLELTAEMRSTLVARVWLMLGSTATGVALREERSPAPAPPHKPPSPSTTTAAPPASRRRRRLQGATGLAAAFPAGDTGFLRYEAPAAQAPPGDGQPGPQAGSSISAQSSSESTGASGSSPAALQLVFVAASPNPIAAYSQAVATLK